MLTYDVNSPLVDDYLTVFPDLTREAAAGSLIDIAQTLAQNEKPPFNPDPAIQGKLEIIYGRIVEDIEQERKNNLEEAGEDQVSHEPSQDEEADIESEDAVSEDVESAEIEDDEAVDELDEVDELAD